MKKTKNSAWKRVAAGSLSMALVAGAMPANVGGFLTGGNAIVAHAETAYTATETRVGLKLNVGDSFVIPESTHVNRYENMILWDSSTYDIGTQARTITVVRGENGALKLDGLDGVEQNFTYPELESSTDQLCIIEYDNNSGWHLCGLARCNAFTGVTSFDGINSYGDTIDGCDVTKVENFRSRNYNVTISNIESGKKVRLTYSDNTTNDIEPTEGTVTFTSALDADFANETNKKVNSVEIFTATTDLTAEDYTAPTAANVTYTGSAQALVTGGGMTEAGAAKGTMQYALGKVITSDINFNDLAVNDILKIRDSSISISNINSIVLAVNTYQSTENNVITISDGDYLYFNDIEMGHTYQGGAAFKVTKIDREQGIVYVEPVDENADLVWSEAVPNATNAGTYSVSWRITGAEGYNDVAPQTIKATIAKATLAEKHIDATTQEIVGDYVAPTAAKTLKTAATDTEPAKYYDDLYYTGENQALINAGSVDDGKGTMQYAIGPYIDTNERVLTTDELKVGTILQPTTETGFTFPENVVVKDGYGSPKRSCKLVCEDGSCKMNFIYNHNGVGAESYFTSGFNAIRIDSIDNNGMLLVSIIKTADLIPTEWANDVPKAKEIGNYNVYYRVKGDANHNDSAPAYVTSKIDYKKSTLTLAASLGAVKVTEVANGTETEVTAVNGAYTLSATKTYKIYTKNTVSTDEKSKYRLTEAYHNKANDNDVFEYEYTLTLAVDPAFGAYNLSHLSNWTGKVYSSDPTKLYIADGAVTEGTGKLAATLKANSTYYYGDLIDDSSVEIDEAYKDLLKVNKIYFSDSTGANVDINKAKFGTYTLTAEIVVDNNANGKFDDKDIDLSYTVYKDVEYKARPMEKNDYFVEIPDGKIKLTVDNGTVTVPEKYYVYSDMIGGSGSDKKYVTTEKNDALSVIFSKCEEKQTFTYNGTEQKPTIIVKNGGNNADVVASIPATDTADAVAKDYIDGVKAKTDAGDYSFKLTAEAGTTEAPANYSGAITVKWTIGKADISKYISVAPKNNVDTDNVVGNDAIVYDGAVLDGTDFEVTKSEAYDNADDATKALVDEFIDQLKAKEAVAADPANNVEAQPAVPAKTFVNVRGGQYEVTTDITYDSEISSSGVSINANSVGSYSNVILKGNLTFECSGGDFTEVKITCGEYVKSGSNSIQLTLDGNDIKCGANIVLTKNDNEWFKIVSITHGYGNETNEYTINLTTVPKTETRNETYDIKNAGNQAANVTVSNSNFKTVEFKQKLDNNGKIDTTVEDKSIPVTIAKRAATITPDEDNRITYRDLSAPTLNYEYEKAATEEALLRGVIAADEGLFDSTKDGYVAPIEVKDFNIGELNDAKSYDYEIVDSEVFANYEFSLPTENAPTFTVDPLDLNDIEKLSIVLNGKTNDWTTDGNSGYYTYDGTTKAVEVKKVAKAAENTALSTVAIDSDYVRTASRNFAVEKADVKLAYRTMDSSTGIINVTNDGFNDMNAILTANSGKVIKSVSFGIDNFGRRDAAPLTEGTTAADIVSNEGGVYDSVTHKLIFNDIESDTFTLSAKKGYKLTITSVEITYGDGDVFVLSRDTDYTVGGMTKSATVGEKTVQVKGKGNYTGVAKATWQIVTAEAGEAALTLNNATLEGESYTKTYDGKAVTGTVAFADLTSDYAVDAEVEYKYYQGKYTKEEVTGDNFNATAIEAPVNAFYSDENNVYHIGTDYTVVATITCDGYADQVLVKTVKIKPINLTVTAAAKNITYGDALPAVTQADIDAINGLTDTDKEYFQKLFTDGKLKFRYPQTGENTYDNTKVQIIPIFTTEDEINAFRNVVLNYNTDNYYWNITNKPKSIKSDDVTVEFTNGNTVVLDENGFVEESSIIVKDTGILNDDGEPTVLLANTDYELNIESTATEGEYIVEIVGKGNYRAIRKVMFTAITAAQAATELTFAEPYLKEGTTNKIILKNTVETDTEKYDIVKNGYVYYTGEGEPSKELTLENVDATLGIKVVGKPQATYSPTLTDSGYGAYVRPYVIVKDKTTEKETTIYLDTQYISAADLAAKSATKLMFAEPYLKEGITNKIVLKNTVETDTEKYDIVKNGYVYYTGEGEPSKELTLENVDATLGIKVVGKPQATYSPTLTDSGYGAYVRPYVIVKDKTTEKETTIYLDTQYISAADLAAKSATKLMFAEPYLKEGTTNKIVLKNTVETDTEKYDIVKNGYVYYTGEGEPSKELTLENVDATLGIKVVGKPQATYSPTLTDSGYGAYVRPYVIVKDKTTEKETTIYLDTQYISAAALSEQ